MNKELIKKRFGRRLDTYDDNAKIQKQMAEKLISKLSENYYENILEIGCGTGILTKIISEKFTFKSYTANDIVNDCEKKIKNVNPSIKFLAGDIEEIVKNSENKYDLIISNASFQWIENLEEFIYILYSRLNPNGILAFTTFGIENYREINIILGKKLNYLSKTELEKLFEKYLPQIEEEVRIAAFNSPLEVLKHIQSTGVNAISSESWTKKDLHHFENEYRSLCFNRPTLTYNPVYVVIKK